MHAMQTLLLGYVSGVTSRLRARLRPSKCRIAQYTRANLTRAAVHGTPQSCRMRATYSRATGAGDPHCVYTLRVFCCFSAAAAACSCCYAGVHSHGEDAAA